MTTMLLLTPGARRSDHRTVLVARYDDEPWLLLGARWWDRVLVRLRALDLDQSLAAGRPPEHDRLHALRAATLVSPTARRTLADNWERTLADRRRPSGARTGRVPLQQARVLAAAANVRRLIEALRAAGPVPARGVALASVLLTDGSSPLYDARSQADLAAAVRDATDFLDPAASVAS
jgi:hypothetical protein